MALTPEQRKLRAQIAAHARWSKTDRVEASARAGEALIQRFESSVDPEGVLPEKERLDRAVNALKAHMLRMRLAQSKARRDAEDGAA